MTEKELLKLAADDPFPNKYPTSDAQFKRALKKFSKSRLFNLDQLEKDNEIRH